MHGPREILNELKWKQDALAEALVHYRHRGAPGDEAVVAGNDITQIGPWFFATAEATIPFHRVLRIERRSQVVWRRPGSG